MSLQAANQPISGDALVRKDNTNRLETPPKNVHRPTSGATLVSKDEHQSNDDPETSGKPPAEASEDTVPPEDDTAARPDLFHRRLYDVLLLTGIFIMLAWPWVFFGVVFTSNGLQATNHFANVVRNNPHALSFFSTLIANIITLMVDILFSFSVVRYAQEWFSEKEDDTIALHVSIVLAFRHMSWPWTWEDLKTQRFQKIKLLLVLLLMTILCFMFVPSSINSIITPAPFNRTGELHGTELDFSSSAPDCINWLATNPIPNQCDWGVYNGLHYTSCLGENQMVDVLEAGRGNILSLVTNNNQSLAFSQLSDAGLHFIGSIKGVLPIGPDGVPAFDTLSPSALSNQDERDGMISYNYTLRHQGLSSNVTCIYDDSTPITVTILNGTAGSIAYQYQGTCDSESMDDVFGPDKEFVQILANNTLLSWTCKSKQAVAVQPSYYIYLRGGGNPGYTPSVGNMTCVVSPVQPSMFNITYQSTLNTFISQSDRDSTPSNFPFPGLLDLAMQNVVGVVWEAQNWESNLVAESVITFGVKHFNLTSTVRDDEYLRLYEAMIQGILEYEATYTRLLYSATSGRPSSCTRDVIGTTSFEVIGWSVDLEHIGFLIPITLMCICALVILILAIKYSKMPREKIPKKRRYYPTGIRPLLVAYMPQDKAEPEPNADSHPWEQKIKYYHQAMKDAAGRAEDDVKDLLSGIIDS